MKLKVLSIDINRSGPIKRSPKLKSSTLEGRILEEDSFPSKSMYAFKYYNEVTESDHGLISATGKLGDLATLLSKSGDVLVKCRFIVVDTLRNNVYYDGNQQDVKIILNDLFDINFNQVMVVADIDEFKKLKTLKLRMYNQKQISSDDESVSELTPFPTMIDELTEGNGVRMSTYEIVFVEEGAFFKFDKFNEILAMQKKGKFAITANGFDEDGNTVKLSSHISKEIQVLSAVKKWGEKLNLDLTILVDAIEEGLRENTE